MSLEWWCNPCRSADPVARSSAQARQQQLTKPRGSLGELEHLAIQLAALQGREQPCVDKLTICIFAADHGVVAEGVSAYPQEVTGQMLHNFVNGGAAISVLAQQLGAELDLINLGTALPLGPLPGVRQLPLGAGSENFMRGAAMSHGQLQAALQAGRDAVTRAVQQGQQLFIGGEMGIGNTTSATALAAALLDCPVAELVGPGTGLPAAGLARKTQVIENALALHRQVLSQPLEVLRCLGGFEIAALSGAYLACAQQGLVALVDGFICSAAALVAVRLNPACRDWLLFSHQSAEPGHLRLLNGLQAKPLLSLGMRLGEGSGAAVAVPLLRLACALHSGMATFAEAAVADRSA